MKKTVVTILGVGLIGLSYYSYKKYKAAKAIIDQLVVVPLGISDFNISLKKIGFKLKLQLINNTHFDLGFTTGSILRLTRIQIYTPTNTLLANVSTSISSIEIPAYGSYELPELAIEIPTDNLLGQLDHISSYLDMTNLKYVLHISAFGKQFTVKT